MLPVTRRSWLRLAGLGSAAAATLFGARRLSGEQNQSSHGAMEHAAHTHGPGRARVDRRRSIPASLPSRLELLGPPARGARALLQGDAAARRHAAARVSDRRRRSRDRDRARRVLPGLDVQRPGARPDHPRDRRRPPAHHVHQRRLASAHDALPRLASSGDGRVDARTPGACRAAGSSTSSTPSRSACISITATPFRSSGTSTRGSTACSSSIRRRRGRRSRRARHGDERLRHQLRRRQRGLRRQHRRQLLHARADQGGGRQARSHLSRQRHRVRPDQQPAPARHVLRRVPHGHARRRAPSRPTP